MGDYLLYALVFVFVVLAGLLVVWIGFTFLVARWASFFLSSRDVIDIAAKYGGLSWYQSQIFKSKIDAAYDEIVQTDEATIRNALSNAKAFESTFESQETEPFTFIDHEPQSAGLDLSEHNRMHNRG